MPASCEATIDSITLRYICDDIIGHIKFINCVFGSTAPFVLFLEKNKTTAEDNKYVTIEIKNMTMSHANIIMNWVIYLHHIYT